MTVALVTGGATGIGAAICRRLADDGAVVHVADIDVEGARRVASEVGGRAVRLDVADEVSWDLAIEQVASRDGSLDVVALNAGVMTRPRGAPLLDDVLPWLTPATARRITAVNVDGVVLGIVKTLPMVRAAAGTVVVTASIAGLQPYVADPFYAMTKHAVIGLVRSLAPTLADVGVRLAAVCPGGVDTGLTPPDVRERWDGAAVGLAPPAFLGDAFAHVLDVGAPGSIWMARPEDGTCWEYELPVPPAAPA